MVEEESLADPELLTEILEAREELESAATTEKVDTLRKTNSGTFHATR